MREFLEEMEKIKRVKQEIEQGRIPVDAIVEPEYFKDDKMIVLVSRTKPWPATFFRAKPKTAYRPTIPQIRVRLRFAEMAKRAKGRKFKADGKFASNLPSATNLPPAALEVKKMKGEQFGRSIKPKKWEIILAETLRSLDTSAEATKHETV